MAKKNREAEAEAPPPAPPSSDEADSDDSDSSASSEPTLPAVEPAGKAKSESESESESDDSPVKPIASKPMDDASKLKKPRSRSNSKPSVAAAASPTKIPAAKRPAEAESEAGKLSKKSKKEKGGGAGGGTEKEVVKKGAGEDEKKQLFQRLWSDDDEIVILKGMLDYAEKKGADPMSDVNDFHSFIKESLHVDVDRKQIADKVRRLRKRYENSVGKKKSFNPHEKNAFELSKKIWGRNNEESVDLDLGNSSMKTRTVSKAVKSAASSGGNGVVGSPRKNGSLSAADNGKKGKIDEAGKREKEGSLEALMGKRCVLMGMDDNIVKAGLSLVGEDKRFEMEEKWREFAVAESELFLKKIDLLHQSSKLIMDALRSAGK